MQELGWLINFQKSELVLTQKLDFLGYHFDLQRGLVFQTQKKLDRLKAQTVSIRKSLVLPSRKHRDISFLGKNSATRKVTHETIPVVPEVALEISPVTTGHKDSSNREFSETPQMVGGSTGAKSCPAHPKGISGALTRSNSAHLFRQQHSSILSEQRRRHTFHRNVCSYLENSGIHKLQKDPDKSKACSWIPKCDSRLPVTKVIQIEWSLHQQIFNQICKVWHTPMVDLFVTHLNHKLPIWNDNHNE